MKFLSRLQFSRGKARMIRRIRKVLRFQAKGESRFVDAALLAGNRSIQVISGIELNSGLGGKYSQNPSRGGFIHFGSLSQLTFGMIQYEVVVVSQAQPQLLILRIDPLADGMSRSKIEWRVLHRLQLSGWNQRRVNRREPCSIDLHHMPQNLPLPLACKVEIGMIGEVEHGIFVGCCRILDPKRASI